MALTPAVLYASISKRALMKASQCVGYIASNAGAFSLSAIPGEHGAEGFCTNGTATTTNRHSVSKKILKSWGVVYQHYTV